MTFLTQPPALFISIGLLVWSLSGFAQEPGSASSTIETTVITGDTVLEPGKTYGRLRIQASNITIDARGATLVGPAAEEGNQRSGTAIFSSGHDNVVLKNISAHGWETGLKLENASGWRIEHCDFSDNFHDPEFGWGENGRRGGIVCERVRDSVISHCKANHVWDACVLVDSDRNKITDNDFSHTSNTCLKLWHSSDNEVVGNNLSYGIRIKQDEVHARDSTGVLIESGSNRNRFYHNDCTHGGDGIFIRVLNGWCSTDNIFVGNDCSHANNNGFECWAPRNHFYGNKANYCSYGFWLGGSDQTRLIDNEASFNGLPTSNHNSPHLPNKSHAGIVFMFGPSSHIFALGNKCEGNNGAGIALIGDQASEGEKWKAYHWVLSGNSLKNNRWGIFAQDADWITLVDNRFSENTESDVEASERVSRLSIRSGGTAGQVQDFDVSKTSTERMAEPTKFSRGKLEIQGPTAAVVQKPVGFKLKFPAKDFQRFEWDLGQTTVRDLTSVEHTFDSPGFYRIGVTASGTAGVELGYRDFYVTSAVPEIAADETLWSFEPEAGLDCTFTSDPDYLVSGNSSTKIVVSPYHGATVRLLYPKTRDAGLALEGKSTLGFWFKAINPNLPGWQSNNPEVTFHQSPGRSLRLTPKRDLLQDPTYSEAREGWRFIQVPLNEDPAWQREGKSLTEVNWLTIGIDSWGGDPLQMWVDGVTLE